jgi:hypothetical protein
MLCGLRKILPEWFAKKICSRNFSKIPATTVCQSAKFIGTSEHPLPLARGMISSEVKAAG